MALVDDRIGKYTVKSFIKEGLYNECYVVQDASGTSYFLKVYDLKRVPSKVMTSDSIIAEIEYCEGFDHPNVIKFVEKGVYKKDEEMYPYYMTEYLSGNMIADPLSKGRVFSIKTALDIIKYALKGLEHIHASGLVHNDITPRNIIYNVSDPSLTAVIDLGHVSKSCPKSISFETSDLTPFFRAPETYNGIYDERSDIYSIAAVLYSMIFGNAPWAASYSMTDVYNCSRMKTIMAERLSFSGGIDKCPSWLSSVLKMCLSFDPDLRIQTARELYEAIESRSCPLPSNSSVRTSVASSGTKARETSYEIVQKKGNGFADVAGMEDIKALLQKKVLFLLKYPEKAKKYNLTPPNGMLLYGPPGCGKTFFAEKFAEEAGLNYILIKASDVGSTYIHGSQGKIAQLFAEAEAKAPSVICFDEFDAMVPKRTASEAGVLLNSEVNEFLSQMNNCSARGVFVIGTTNQKDLIDPAVLRTGRMDLHVEIGAPDLLTRKKIFDLYLSSRPCSGIDTDRLAEITQNFSSSDISYIVNDAAMVAAFTDSAVTQELLEDSIRNRPSSLKPSGDMNTRRKIGF